MDRRTFLAGTGAVLLAGPLAGETQQAKKVYRIGYLNAGSATTAPNRSENFLQGLRDLGYVEGRVFVMEYRYAEGHQDRLPGLAADLVRERVDVIVTGGTPATTAAKQATQTIPIVFAALGFAVERGMVGSLARPGGNITGLTFQIRPGKLVELLKEVVPTMTRVVYLYDPSAGIDPRTAERVQSQMQLVNVQSQTIAVRDSDGITEAFAKFGRGTNGLVVEQNTHLQMAAAQICGTASQRRLPAAGVGRSFADAGCLISYGENQAAMYRRAAAYVDKILRGAKPADLPVEQPTKFELAINLKTAKALGLTIPPSLLGLGPSWKTHRPVTRTDPCEQGGDPWNAL